MKLGIVMPAYNEEKRIGNTLENYSSFFEKLRKKDKKFDYHILVSINNTKDNTLKIVQSFSKKNKKISSINLIQGGKGYAIVEGFKVLLKKDFDYIGFVDADNATLPDAFFDLVKNVGNADGAIANRYVLGAIVNPKPTIQRIIVSRMFNFLTRIILFINYNDTQCGAKIFTKSSLIKVVPRLTLSQWAFDVDLLYQMKKAGFNIREIPTIWSDKNYSKIKLFKAGPLMFLGIVRLRLLNSPFKGLINIYGFFFNNKIINAG